MAKAKRIGANERQKRQGQKQAQKQRLKNSSQAVREGAKKSFGWVSLCTVICVLGYALISQVNWKKLIEENRTQKVEWSSIALMNESEVVHKEKTLSALAYLQKDSQMFLLRSDGSKGEVEESFASLPVVVYQNDEQLQESVLFLKNLKDQLPSVFASVSQLSWQGNWLELFLDGIHGKVILNLEEEPFLALRRFQSFAKRYPVELERSKLFDLRFAGFVFATRSES